MKFSELLDIVGDEPVFGTGLLLAGLSNVPALQRQLAGWVRAGRLIRIRKALYALAPPHRKADPDPFVVSNRLVAPSYVSLESALHFHEMIPDVVQGITASIDREALGHMVERFASRKVQRAARLAVMELDREQDGWVTL